MKKLLSVLIFVSTVIGVYGQNNAQLQLNNSLQTNIPALKTCDADAIHNHLMATDPAYKQKMDNFNALLKNSTVQNKSGTIYQVPVVVHIMHPGEPVGTGTNITDDQVRDGIDYINQRFRKIAGGLGDGNGEDIEIEFALAIRDESNNCTNGIIRYDMTGVTDYDTDGVRRYGSNGPTDAQLKSYSRWNPTEYYNIYIINMIDAENCYQSTGGYVAGYAYLAGAHGNSVDGAVMLACTFTDESSTTFTHELGHAFNLYHTFEDDNGGTQCPTGSGDFCNDTPKHIRTSSHPDYFANYGNCAWAGSNSCDAGTTQDHMFNYMDYAFDNCQDEFTTDQKTRMQAAMTGTRASFLQSNGNMSLVPTTTATVDFSASSTAICVNNSVTFYDESSCTPNTYTNSTWTGISFLWTFDDGVNPAITSTDQNPTINFTVAGNYDVTLQVTNSFGTTSKTVNSYVNVSSGSVTSACTPTSANPSGNYGYTMSNFSFNTLSNTTSTGTNQEYVDYTCTHATSVNPDSSYTMSVTLNNGSTYSEDVDVYIDYNDDGTFSAGEKVMSATLSAGSGTGTFNQVVTIPTSPTTGKMLRMRAYVDANGTGTACANTFVGDIEDYGIYIATVSSCNDPDVPTISGTTTICNGNSTTLSIASGQLNDATDWQWYTSSCGGTSAGNGTSLMVSPTSTTTYYVRGEGGCVTLGSCASVTVTVNDVPGNTGSIIGSNSVCENATGIGYSIAAVSGATNYTWSVPTGAIITSGQGSTSISVDFGTTSGTVKVIPDNSCGVNDSSTMAVTVNACSLGPNIRGTHCNRTLTSESQFTNCKKVTGATQYEFLLTEIPSGNPVSSCVRNNSYFNLKHLSNWQYNTTYEISARAYVSGSWTNYGTPCDITTPGIPTIYIRTTHCNRILNSATEFTNCTNVSNATQYEFKIVENASGTPIDSVIRNNSYFNFSHLSGWSYSTVYDVSARAYINGSWTAYGPSCQTTSPASARLAYTNDGESSTNLEVDATSKLEMTIYPNPSQGELIYLQLLGAQDNSQLMITDISGKILQQQFISSDTENHNSTIRFNEKLNSGFYMITVISGNQKITKKLIVR